MTMKEEKMKLSYALLFVFACIFVSATYSQAPAIKGVKWQGGPSNADLGEIASINISTGYVFADGNDTRILMEAMKNPPSGKELGFVSPEALDWFVVFAFDEVGYVRDDEKNSLDADAMLESIKKGTEAANKERQRRGWPILTVIGWEQEPHYNNATHNLEWAVKFESEGQLVINYNTRLLGRGGVMRISLVTDPQALQTTLPKFRNLLDGFDFKQGHRYTEFRQGDKIAEYGLTALVVGGATAVAVKSGAFKWIWKILVAGFLALAAFIKRLFTRKKSQSIDP